MFTYYIKTLALYEEEYKKIIAEMILFCNKKPKCNKIDADNLLIFECHTLYTSLIIGMKFMGDWKERKRRDVCEII